jgi:hypothetical protein
MTVVRLLARVATVRAIAVSGGAQPSSNVTENKQLLLFEVRMLYDEKLPRSLYSLMK